MLTKFLTDKQLMIGRFRIKMKKIFNILFLLLAGLLFSLLSPARLSAVAPNKALYQSTPFTTTYRMIPHVLLVLSKHINMFQQAYPGVVDMDGDGRVDTGFNPAVEYVGIFDSRSCYAYNGSVFIKIYQNFATGDPVGYFSRKGPTLEDDSEETIWSQRPVGLPGYVVSPRSKTGICREPGQSVSETFSGNWLNYITSSRMDAVRRILYGGSRTTDTAAATFLSGSYVPQDSTVWGSEVRSDDTWAKISPLSAYHDIRKYTPYPKPANGKAHFFSRGSDLSKSDRFPAMRVILDTDSSEFNAGSIVSSPTTIVHYWDWTVWHRPLSNDKQFVNETVRKRVKVYQVRVVACSKGNIGEGEGCLRYPGFTASEEDDVYKPGGLLQKYGGAANAMYFGLLTGGYNYNIRNNGGKLRNHVGPVYGSKPTVDTAYTPSVDEQYGNFLEGGLISNIEKLHIAGRNREADPESAAGFMYFNVYSWGNPLGEMTYEAVRYLAGALSPTPAFSNQADVDDVSGSTISQLTEFGSETGAWNARKPGIDIGSCFKPVLLIISDVNTDYDGDSVGTDLERPALSGTLGGGLTTDDLPVKFAWVKYLDTITKLEGLDQTGKVKYTFSTGETDKCSSKDLSTGLAGVKGICPIGPSFMGTYSSAAAAYFAHIHDFNISTETNKQAQGVDVYAMSMSAAYPELVLRALDASGNAIKKVSILPVNISGTVNGGNRYLGFLNYFMLDWETDRRGTTFHAKIMVNFSDYSMGDDWEGDALVTYTVDMLTDNSTPVSLRETTEVVYNSGDPTVTTGKTYYRFKNPTTADSVADFIEIEPNMVKALLISTEFGPVGTGVGLAMGYTVSGTQRDGTYLEITLNTPPAHANLTPIGCPWVGALYYNCGTRVTNQKTHTRIFAFEDSSADLAALPDPLWLAAKYGGFKDRNRNSIPDPGEWEGQDGQPANYFQAKNIAELAPMLEAAFQGIAKSVSTGTSTAASINSVLSGGISIQTAFYPTFVSPKDPNKVVNWVGTVYALFVDKYGNLRENDSETGENYLGSDNSVLTFNSVSSPPDPPPACYTEGNSISRCKIDFRGEVIEDNKPPQPDNIHQIKAVWDVGKYLSEHSPETRNIYYISPTTGEAIPFKEDSETSIDLNKYMLHDNFASVLYSTSTAPAKLEATKRLIRYIRGYDYPEFRSRQMDNPWGNSPPEITWRLGDIINSKPVIVGQPPFNYDYLYNDRTYSAFKAAKATRRQVAYFGCNDGFLHAVNMGKFGSLLEGRAGYDPADKDLGQELWALIPDAALPHLQWLADLAYAHSYYVDMKPLIADINFGGNDWRTILICGLRLGGRPIESPESTTSSPKNFYSEVFALDVTDPDAAPKVLWRFSSPELGLSVGLPTVVTNGGFWYAILPSGPATDKVDSKGKLDVASVSPYEGNSSQRARLFILNAKTGEHLKTLVVEEEGAENSFFNDPFVPLPLKGGQDGVWHDEVIYYGLTISRDGECLDKGGVYRLQMVSAADDDPDTTDGLPLSLSQWSLKPFISVDRPVTGAVNSAFDYQGNLWVLFGTGRLWSEADLAPCAKKDTSACRENHEQYIFGVKEELKNGLLTFKTQKVEDLLDVSNGLVYKSEDVGGIPDFGLVAYEYLTNYLATSTKAGYKRKLNLGSFLLNQNLNEIALTQPQVTSLGSGRSVLALTTYAPGHDSCGDVGQGFMYVVDPFTGLAAPYLAQMFKLVTQSGGVTSQATGEESAEELIIPGGASTGEGQPSAAVLVQAGGSLIVRATTTANATIDGKVTTDEMVTNAIVSWREVFNTGFQMPKAIMSEGLLDPLP
jgi:type IV pilus assembly protein PilY1